MNNATNKRNFFGKISEFVEKHYKLLNLIILTITCLVLFYQLSAIEQRLYNSQYSLNSRLYNLDYNLSEIERRLPQSQLSNVDWEISQGPFITPHPDSPDLPDLPDFTPDLPDLPDLPPYRSVSPDLLTGIELDIKRLLNSLSDIKQQLNSLSDMNEWQIDILSDIEQQLTDIKQQLNSLSDIKQQLTDIKQQLTDIE